MWNISSVSGRINWIGKINYHKCGHDRIIHGLNNKILNSSILSVKESFHLHRWYFQSYFRCKIKWWKFPADIHIFRCSNSCLYVCKSWNFYCAWHMLLLIPFSVTIFYLLRLVYSRELISPKKRHCLTKLSLYLLWLRWCFLCGVSNCCGIWWSFRLTEHLMLSLQGTCSPSRITSNRRGEKKRCCKTPSAALHFRRWSGC